MRSVLQSIEVLIDELELPDRVFLLHRGHVAHRTELLHTTVDGTLKIAQDVVDITNES